MNKHLSNIELLIQQSALADEEKQKLLKEISNAGKHWNIIEFNLDRTEKVKHTNAILLEETIQELEQKRKAVEAQNLELEIEAALERVRSVAMGMKEPADMLEICKAISHELALLNVKEIRNVQTAIFYEGNGTYMNYEYYAKHDKTFITETSYTDHAIHQEFAAQMLKGKNELFTRHINKDELPDWIAYQKTTNVFIDTYLETASSLSYYWHSLGPVALGISTYKPLSEEDKALFKRFLKVFELSYTRYLDIERAIEQAREAQVQLALERVRARTMAMQNSDELSETAYILFQQFRQLGDIPLQITIGIFNEEKGVIEFRITGFDGSGSKVDQAYNMNIHEPVLLDKLYADWKEQKKSVVRELTGKEMRGWTAYRNSVSGRSEAVSTISDEERRYVGVGFFSKGLISFSKPEPIESETINILERFAGVFEQTYTRFLDLQKAEAQAREAKIEAALERVRSTSMAMHSSNDLHNVIRVLTDQLSVLGFYFHTANFITNDSMPDWEIWISSPGVKGVPARIHVPYMDHILFNQMNEAIAAETEFLTVSLNKEEKDIFFHYLFENTAATVTPAERKQWVYQQKGMGLTTVLMKDISLSVINYDGILYTAGENEVIKRLTNVFEQSYRRFLDLQNAETQAREAQLQLALERIRARTMAMHRSDELSEVLTILFEQYDVLEVDPVYADLSIFDLSANTFTWRCTGKAGQRVIAEQLVDIDSMDIWKDALAKWKSGETYEVVTLFFPKEVLPQVFELFNEIRSKIPKDAIFTEKDFPDGLYTTQGFCKFGALGFGHSRKPTEEEKNIVAKFATEFERLYQRFLDLQKAEAQAREAQIEAALEKVRSRSLAMHKSDELQDVVHTVFEKLKELNVDVYTAIIFIFTPGSKDVIWWLTNKANQQYSRILVPYADNPYLKDIIHAKENGMELFSKNYSYEEKNGLFRHLFENTDFKYVPEQQKKFLFESEFATMSVALTKNIGINITSYSRISFSESDNEILKRFAKVFDQAYTRFLDLQRAEAQAREAQIEAALERVRSRSIGMQKSEELREVIQIVFEQLQQLNFNIDSAHFNLNFRESDDYNLWSAAPGLPYPVKTYIPYFDHPVFIKAREAKEKGLDFFTESYTKGEKNAFFEHLFTNTKTIPEERKKYILSSPGVAASTVMMNSISLWIMNYAGVPYSDVENAILKRFGKIFEQSYTRFLDLQKAEVQAHEAQIEAALERVRSRTLAMQKSDELAETAAVLFKQLIGLGIAPNRLYIGIIQDDSGTIEFWITDEDGTKVSTMFSGSAYKNTSVQKMYEGWKAQQKTLIIDMQGQELADYFHYAGDELHVPFKNGLSQKRRLQYIAYFSRGFIGMASPEEQPKETVELLNRFAYVFNLTFTRFNDLKIAEAHALQAEQDLVEIKAARKKAEDALTELQATQKQLIQSEKMASLGELTAGIAHEIQNPLNFVNNFSEVSKELIDEMTMEFLNGNANEALGIATDLKDNLEKINHHGKRADAIVKGMLQHSKTSTGQKEPTDINVLCDEYLRLSYHGLRAKDKTFNATMKTDFDESIGKINVVPQDIGRVLLNLFNNAFYAVKPPNPPKAEEQYKPLVSVTTRKITPLQGMEAKIEITVSDNGNGIPQNIVDKIFQPFFTTKPTGSGTGLGLSLAYDIIKAHGGEIKVESKEGQGSAFTVVLPA